ncbi:uncharacterized protein LOC141626947 [Silene latifolia]|uniref:uncharacterized protein LOC141626947 n=1 Tax=Silene latifolia TaxID=37657 RepID=UPI003D77CCEC
MAEALRAWARANKEVVKVKQGQVVQVRVPDTRHIITSIKMLRSKKASHTLQEERHWLYISVPEFDRKDVRFYLGCSHCGTRSNIDINVKYKCDACHRENVNSSPRMNITFEAIDETGSYTFTTFTEDAEKLLEAKATALHAMSLEAKQSYLTERECKLRVATTSKLAQQHLYHAVEFLSGF